MKRLVCALNSPMSLALINNLICNLIRRAVKLNGVATAINGLSLEQFPFTNPATTGPLSRMIFTFLPFLGVR